MKKLKLFTAIAVAALTLSLGGKALAQPQGFGGGMNFQNMDPQQMIQQMQQRMNDSYRDQMGVTNDDDWSLILQRINAVEKARMATMADGGGMMGMGGMRGGPGGPGGPGGGFQNLFGQPSPESTALQRAVDSNAPMAQIKDLMTKFQAVRQAKQAALAKTQDDLRSVLTVRQEAIATLGGLLD